MSLQPYRVPSPPPRERKRKPERELVYRTTDHERNAIAARAALQVGIVGAVIAVVVAAAGSSAGSILVCLVTAIVAAMRWGRAPDAPGIEIHVEDGRIEITSPKGDVLLRARLDDVANVSLDTKSIANVQDGNALDVAMRGESRVRPELDVSRIVVSTYGTTGAGVRLTDAYVAHMDAVEWLGKIRTFPRSHGWVPEEKKDDDEEAGGSP